MSDFVPSFCPRPACPSRHGTLSFHCRKAGFFPRRADGRRVQRFFCRACRCRFSSQSFRLDHGLRKPYLNVLILGCLVSKVTLRQTARILCVDRKTIAQRLRRFGPALRAFHFALLARAREGFAGSFSLDELETYEHNRRLRPLTVPVLIHRATRFVVHAEVGQLPARKAVSALDRQRKAAAGPRPSESRRVVRATLEALARLQPPGRAVELVTDRKSTYRGLARAVLGARLITHVRESARTPRNTSNVLFQINHTFATMRDTVSRLVRRTWAASKRRTQLVHHLWIWVAWRNYVRPLTVDCPQESAATRLRLVRRRLRTAEILRWRWPLLSLPHSAAF